MGLSSNQLPISLRTGTNWNTAEGPRSLCIMVGTLTGGPERGGADDAAAMAVT